MLRFATSNIQPFRKILKYVRALGKARCEKICMEKCLWKQNYWAVSQDVRRICGIRKVLYISHRR
jgi:hypothetical protein